MRHRRHAILCVPLPDGFVRTSAEQIPPEFVFVPRIALGEAAAVAVKLNADQIAAGDVERKLFLPVKCFEPLKRRRQAAGQKGGAV